MKPDAPTRSIREAVLPGPKNISFQLAEENVPVLIWDVITGDIERKQALLEDQEKTTNDLAVPGSAGDSNSIQ